MVGHPSIFTSGGYFCAKRTLVHAPSNKEKRVRLVKRKEPKLCEQLRHTFHILNQGIFRGNDLTLELTGPPEPSLVTSLLVAGPERANCEAHPPQEFANLFSDNVSNLFFGHSCHLSTDHAHPRQFPTRATTRYAKSAFLQRTRPFSL